MKTRLETQEVEVRPPDEADARRDPAPDLVHLICAIQEDLTPGNPVRKSAPTPPPQAHSLPLWLSRTQSNLVVLNPTAFFLAVISSQTQSHPVKPFALSDSSFSPACPEKPKQGQQALYSRASGIPSPELMSIIVPLGAGSLTTVHSRPQ